MTYAETLDYLYSRLPMFTRIGAAALKKDLTNTITLCSALDNPHQKFKSIHIAGTNGKGSSSHILAAILQTAGYKTGLYTSPHLLDFRERIRINGEMIQEEEVIGFVQSLQPSIETIEPSFFEVTVAMAFQHFADHEVDIAVIETGLGGRLDSTNIITPLLSLITNIGYDHVNILGDTLQAIASEKAGIIKPDVPVIISQKQEEIAKVFLDKALECNSEIEFASENWKILESAADDLFRKIKIKQLSNDAILDLELDLPGSYQLKNIKGVLSAVNELRKQGFSISDEHIQTALSQVKTLTGLSGRWHTISSNPLIICDTGHNEDGIREVLKNIEATTFAKLHMVIGMVKDKDISKVLSLLPKTATYYFCQPDLERAKSVDELASEAAEFHLKGNVYLSVKDALRSAKENAQADDLIFVGGSTFVVAEALT